MDEQATYIGSDLEPDIDLDDIAAEDAADDRDWVSLLELSWDEEAAQDEWVDSAMSYLREQNPEPPF